MVWEDVEWHISGVTVRLGVPQPLTFKFNFRQVMR
jgi:hypothetical protein